MSVFRAEKGLIYWQSHELEDADVQYLQAVYRDETIAALRANDTAAQLNAQDLLNDLYRAIVAQKQWWKLAGARSL